MAILRSAAGSSAQLSLTGFLPFNRRRSMPIIAKASALTQEVKHHRQLRSIGQDDVHKHSLRLSAILGLEEIMTVGDVYRLSTVYAQRSRHLSRRLPIVPSSSLHIAPRRFNNDTITMSTSLALLASFWGQ